MNRSTAAYRGTQRPSLCHACSPVGTPSVRDEGTNRIRKRLRDVAVRPPDLREGRLALDIPLPVSEDGDVGGAVAVVVAGHGDVSRLAPDLREGGLALDVPLPASEDGDVGGAVAVVVAGDGDVSGLAPDLREGRLALHVPLPVTEDAMSVVPLPS